MNRRIKKEIKRLGYAGKKSMPLHEASIKLFHLVATHNGRLDARKESENGLV